MRYILYVSVEGLYVGAHSVEDAARLVVHRERVVLDAGEEAFRRGVRVGMPLAEARAILGSEGHFLPWSEEAYRAAQDAWLERCAELTSVIEPHEQHAAWLDLSAHAEPFTLCRSLRGSLSAGGYERVRMGLARAKWLALLCATLHGHEPQAAWEIIASECLHDPAGYLAELPVESLLPATEEDRRRLRFLGYTRIGQVARLPLQLLRAQFAERALTIAQAARGGFIEPVAALYPRDAVRSVFHIPGGAESHEQLRAVLTSLADEIGRALRERDAQGSRVELQVGYADGSTETSRRTFLKPLDGPRSVLVALTLMLGEARKPVLDLSVSVTELKKPSGVQSDLSRFLTSARSEASMERALGAVRMVYGQDCVLPASELAKNRRARLMRAWKEATGWR